MTEISADSNIEICVENMVHSESSGRKLLISYQVAYFYTASACNITTFFIPIKISLFNPKI
jgi:hypothetical protein